MGKSLWDLVEGQEKNIAQLARFGAAVEWRWDLKEDSWDSDEEDREEDEDDKEESEEGPREG